MFVFRFVFFFFFKQKTAYEMRIRDGSSVVCSSDLAFETVLFYAALWSQGHHGAILAGAAAAVAALAVIAWLMLRYSRRMPFGTFFAVSAALVAVLAVVLAGKGVAALQEAGWLPMAMFDGPRIDLLGIHPTVQGISVQLAVLAVLLDRKSTRLNSSH